MNKLLPVIAAAMTGIFVGSTIVATRFVIVQTDPGSLAFLRYAIGLLCLLPALLFSAKVRFDTRDLLPIALLGITQFGILIALLNYGLQYIGSALGALIFSTFPVLTMILAAAMGVESLTLIKSIGVLLSIFGVALALGGQSSLWVMSLEGWIGALAVLGSAFSGALCSVLYRPYLRKYPALQVSAFAMLASLLFLAFLAGWEGFFTGIPRFTPGGWLVVLFIGLSSGSGYFLWLWALQHTTPTKVSIFLSLSPLTATGLGALLLAEEISAWFLAGLLAVVIGLCLANWPGARTREQ